jgi:hypothetical protein
MIINSTINKTDRVVNSTIYRKYGVDGKSIEADIDIANQRVGFKQEGEANFEYIDLPKLEFDDLTQAEKDSLKGSDANVTSENIATALGYTPADADDVQTPVPANAVFTDTVYDDTAIQAEVTANTTDRHTHINKAIIDKFGEDAQGNPTYNGTKIDTTIAQRDVYDGLDSTNNTISLSANNGKVLKDVQDSILVSLGDIGTALDTINGQII